MVTISLDDDNVVENFKAIYELQKAGVSDEEIQKMYDRQVAADKKRDTESENNNYLFRCKKCGFEWTNDIHDCTCVISSRSWVESRCPKCDVKNEGVPELTADRAKSFYKAEVMQVKELGELIGYGNIMDIASALWAEELCRQNVSSDGALYPALVTQLKDNDLKQNAIKNRLQKIEMYRNFGVWEDKKPLTPGNCCIAKSDDTV